MCPDGWRVRLRYLRAPKHEREQAKAAYEQHCRECEQCMKFVMGEWAKT